ncbi:MULTISPECIES: phosphorothioated DNA-binding restriction endonuclease [Streptomyces]|uniref:Restriction endonuclease n=1 Tax=Streptomyces xinghaiensis TaxID=1038928 RepID=A0A3R7EN85_9ACTN|nr:MULTISPECIES: HNH endonuclease [Streptomyces]OFA52327.1 restriction endonuclease [Streptomyces fradiae]PQM20995.1 restriction endonuclease [Streptomyces xinghaiensis]RKM92849.1 restriction endonuclease [Streptomyces xinghaiensis]RNC72437.1 restriction endonuclease [Streptomyces xinghaiensis]
MTRDELLNALAALRRARIGAVRAPHKPLLLLWLLGRFTATGSTAVAYEEAEEPVSRLINDYGPAVMSPALARQRAAMPFVQLERTLWALCDGNGRPIGPDAPERGAWLREHGATGRLLPCVEQLLADPGTLTAATRILLDQHFTPSLETAIRADTGLDSPAAKEGAELCLPSPSREPRRQPPVRASAPSARRAGFAEEVLRAYAYSCAICGYDGALGRSPVGLEAAHIRWNSQDGPDTADNALALCAQHHTLFDYGVLGLTEDLRIRVSGLYTCRSDAGRAVDGLHDKRLAAPRPGSPAPAPRYVAWHSRQVFKHTPERVPGSVPAQAEGGGDR